MSQCRIGEQGVDRGQPGVAGPDAVLAVMLEMVKERADHRRVQVGEVEPARQSPGPPGSEAEQQPQRVPVGGDRVGASPALACEPFGKKRLHRAGDRGHRGCPGAGCGSDGGLPRRAARGRPAGTSRCARARRGRGRPTAAASAQRYRRRRGTNPAGCRPRTNASGHAAAGAGSRARSQSGLAGQPGERLADIVIQQPGARAGYQQCLAARPGNRWSRSWR